jgi:DNA-binding CsgD family transcriptional regulator
VKPSPKRRFSFKISSKSGRREGVGGLTAKERTILDWLSLGQGDKAIAEHTGLKLWTVRDRLRRIFRVLGVTSSRGAVAAYLNGYRKL